MGAGLCAYGARSVRVSGTYYDNGIHSNPARADFFFQLFLPANDAGKGYLTCILDNKRLNTSMYTDASSSIHSLGQWQYLP